MSIGVLPTRSPMPIAVPCSRVAPAYSAASELITAKSRSRWPCQSMPTLPPHSSTIVATNLTTAAAPSGVACPTVSATHTRDAPARIAVVYSFRSVSGIRPRRVLRHVEHRKALADGEGDGFFGETLQLDRCPTPPRTAGAGSSR